MAWFAFYVLRGGGSGGAEASGAGKSRYGYVSALGPGITGSMMKVRVEHPNKFWILTGNIDWQRVKWRCIFAFDGFYLRFRVTGILTRGRDTPRV